MPKDADDGVGFIEFDEVSYVFVDFGRWNIHVPFEGSVHDVKG